MTVVSNAQLSRDMQRFERELIDKVGLVPQAMDRPLQASDLLFYLSETSMPMAAFLQQHNLFMGSLGLQFDLTQFSAIRELAETVISDHAAGNLEGVWRKLDLSSDEDADYNGTYILTVLAALELLYGAKS